MRTMYISIAMPMLVAISLAGSQAQAANSAEVPPQEVRFCRHVVALFSRLGCNGGTCHGAVQGKNGFRLTLFGTGPEQDHEDVARASAGRRINPLVPEQSLLLLKPTGQVAHGGGQVLDPDGPEFVLLRRWIAAGGRLDPVTDSRLSALHISPAGRTLAAGGSYQLAVEAEFADGSREDVTGLCAFETLDDQVATVSDAGRVTAVGVGDVAIRIRYRDEPATAMVLVPRVGSEAFPQVAPQNFVDEFVLAKLRRLNVPPTGLADDATFLRRARLDVTGKLPTPDEVRAFLADAQPDKRQRKIDELLSDDGYAALWALKFCDLLGATEFGVYADGMREEADAPRFLSWVRARLAENTRYDEFATRILTATSREGRSLEEWAAATEAIEQGYHADRVDTRLYEQRETLDLYWQRKSSTGVPATLQVAHAFLGLRLECSQCHRHPHDIWQQDDLLSFANFFSRIRKVGFQGQNEKNFPEVGAVFKRYTEAGKKLQEEAKRLKEGELKRLRGESQQAKTRADQLRREIEKLVQQAAPQAEGDSVLNQKQQELADLEAKQAEFEKLEAEVREKERQGKLLPELAKRLLHAEVRHLPDDKQFASVTSPLGTARSEEFRLLGETTALQIEEENDPRQAVAEWILREDNPYFAKAIVNRVWAHYFGRGIIEPPDDLSPFNPPSHPELLARLVQEFVAQGYDLKWLHRTILTSRTYQQSSQPLPESAIDRTNYAYFYYRRLPAEVLLDALNFATGTQENMEMKYHHWPERMTTVEIPFLPRNEFVKFVLEQFGKPTRNSAVQCDCQRSGHPSVLQVLTLANHPHVWEKINDAQGRVARISKEIEQPAMQVEALYLAALGRPPSDDELRACLAHVTGQSPAAGLPGVLWSLINTREFLLQH